MLGRLILANFVTQICVDLVSIKLADRIGYRACMIAGQLCTAVGLLGLTTLPFLLPPYVGLTISIILAAIGGGMIRDVLLREMPFVLKKRVYAVAAILGALGYALLLRVGLGEVAAYGLGMLITTAVRMLATVFKWNLPKALE